MNAFGSRCGFAKRACTAVVSAVVFSRLCLAEDATIQAPKDEKQIPIIEPQPAKEDSLDRLKKLWPKRESGESTEKQSQQKETEPAVEPQSPFEKVVFQLKDYNWEQNVNLHIGSFTILGYRDANSNDRMLFRFLTPQEHAEKRVMNSKASLLYIPPKKKQTSE